MRRSFVFLLFCLTLSEVGRTQDYYPIIASETSYFGKPDSTLFLALKVDSSKTKNGETTHYLFKQLRWANDTCITSHGASWLGDTIHVSATGWVTFTNRLHQPFVFSYKAPLGTQWTAFTADTWKADAKVTSHSQEMFLGLEDSVKTITLDIVKLDGSPLIHPYSYMEIKLSKHYGLIKLINFYTFNALGIPQHPIPSFEEDTEVLNLPLIGLEKAQIGMTNLTAKGIFDYQVADEWHVETYSSQGIPFPNPQGAYSKFNVLSRKQTADTAFYETEVISQISGAVGVTKDTVLLKHAFMEFLEVPGAVIWQSSGHSYQIHRIEKQNGRRNRVIYPIGVHNDGSGCLKEIIFGGMGCMLYETSYVEGLGGGYWYCAPMGLGSSVRRLTYYKKGNQEWGAPLVLGIDEEKAYDKFFQLYPNPAKGQVQLRNLGYSGSVSVVWYNLQGGKVKEHTAQGSEVTLDVSEMPSGMYVYEVQANQQVLKKGRLVVQ